MLGDLLRFRAIARYDFLRTIKRLISSRSHSLSRLYFLCIQVSYLLRSIIETENDKWKDYWLPHFQIDIDIHLGSDEIESLIRKIFQGKVYPHKLIEVGEFTIVVRARLGVISGINISLDIGYEGRMTRYHRVKLLTELV